MAGAAGATGPTGATGPAGDPSLHSALLAVKVWDTSAYVWPGDGIAPDSSAWTDIVFVDPDGTHDPALSTGGRDHDDDLWETGSGGSTASLTERGVFAASTAYDTGDLVTYGSHRFVLLGAGFTSGSTFDPADWVPLDRLSYDNPGAWSAANAKDQEFDGSGSSPPSGWSLVGTGSSYSEALGRGVITGTTALNNGIAQSLPAGSSFEYVAEFSFIGPNNTARLIWGVRESSTGHISVGFNSDTGIGAFNYDGDSFVGEIAAISRPDIDNLDRGYVRLRKNSATSWDFAVSREGSVWLTIAAAWDPTGWQTPDQFIIGPRGPGSGSVSVSVEFVRVR